MRKLLVLALVLVAGTAFAVDPGNQAPVKAEVNIPENVPIPRQGGDTIFDATVVTGVPYSNSGTTAGYFNDYDEVCPFSGSTSPDVVYVYMPGADENVDVDLCGSMYDTKVYVYDGDLNLVACNDDFYYDDVCGVYVSKVENVALMGGGTYYIVVDGYGGSFGDYLIEIVGFEPCVLDCPAGGALEGEPTLVDEYVDDYNGGCNYDPANPAFQTLVGDANGDLTFCGVSGWYFFQGLNYRDTDWLILIMGPNDIIDITMDAEYPTYFFELFPQDCNSVGVVQSPIGGPCLEAYMTISGYGAGATVWFWAGPSAWEAMTAEYNYLCWFTGLEPGIATEATSWSNVKALFQ